MAPNLQTDRLLVFVGVVLWWVSCHVVLVCFGLLRSSPLEDVTPGVCLGVALLCAALPCCTAMRATVRCSVARLFQLCVPGLRCSVLLCLRCDVCCAALFCCAPLSALCVCVQASELGTRVSPPPGWSCAATTDGLDVVSHKRA